MLIELRGGPRDGLKLEWGFDPGDLLECDYDNWTKVAKYQRRYDAPGCDDPAHHAVYVCIDPLFYDRRGIAPSAN
jgi:hypothetical protein